MELARLETTAEADFIFREVTYYGTGALSLAVDATTLTPGKTGWRWIRSNYPIDYNIRWATGEPNEPAGGRQACLSILRTATGVTAAFADISCITAPTAAENRRVLCQLKHENFLHRIINNQGK